MRKITALVISAFLLSMATAPVKAATFTFSFNNTNNGGGMVAGTLTLNAAETAAVSLTVDTNTQATHFGIGQYVPGVTVTNSFTVTNGQITAAEFFYRGMDNSSPNVTCCSLALGFITGSGLSTNPGGLDTTFNANLTFTPVVIPLPATLPLFATGLSALGLLGWRRRMKVST